MAGTEFREPGSRAGVRLTVLRMAKRVTAEPSEVTVRGLREDWKGAATALAHTETRV